MRIALLSAKSIVIAAAITVPLSLTIHPGEQFASTSYLHTPLAPNAALDANSARYVSKLYSLTQKYNYAPNAYATYADINISGGSAPIWIVDANTPKQQVLARVNCGSSCAYFQKTLAQTPIPQGFAPDPGTDAHAVIYDPSNDRMFELWEMTQDPTSGAWMAQWGGVMENVSKNPGYFVNDTSQGYTIKFGGTATGIPLMGGMMTINELMSTGDIKHALGLSIPEAKAGNWSWPAQRSDGGSTARDAIPEGAMFRLPASLDLTKLGLDPLTLRIAKAVQTYGLVIWDISGTVNFRAENPLNRYPSNPYYQVGGILDCPPDTVEGQWPNFGQCWAPQRLRNFPWNKLQMLKLHMDH